MDSDGGNLMAWGRRILDQLENNDFREGRNTTQELAAILQPASFGQRGAHPEFPEVLNKFSHQDVVRRLDVARVWSLMLNVKAALSRTDGAIAELGVYLGHSAAVLAHYAEQNGRPMYLIDTFNGFAREQVDPDSDQWIIGAFRDTSVEKARETVGGYTGNRWIAGHFPECITSELSAERFAFVSIDADLYAPIMDGLQFFYPRLNEGGVILVHDYSSELWNSARRAVDDFCNNTGLTPILLPDFGGSAAMTKGRQAGRGMG